jgi:NMD protein affecting ribosome stability and mRNA decay
MNSGATMATSMSTLMQSTLDQALEKMRHEHEWSIEKLRQDMQTKIQSMENSIATAVISAIRQTPSVVNMETESLDGQSMQSTQDTNATIKTLSDNLTNLANVVNLLSEKVIKLSKKKEIQNKRSRPKINTTPRQLAQALDNEHQTQQSPPTKQPRASVPTPPATPPPYGTPKTGAREGS